MSSFAGHALAAATAFALWPRAPRALWAGWLVALAIAPDVDYAVRSLDLGPDRSLRVTHSLALSSALPALTAGAMLAWGVRGRELVARSAQAFGAGLSHLLLDLSVGVTPLPLLWPATDERLRLPFGLLPSAGRLDPKNPILYRNLIIELGALVPLALALVLAFGPPRAAPRRGATIAVLLAVAAAFMAWAASLPR